MKNSKLNLDQCDNLPFNISKSLQGGFAAVASLEEGKCLKGEQHDTKESLVGSEWKNRRTLKHAWEMDKIKKSEKNLINFNSSLTQSA